MIIIAINRAVTHCLVASRVSTASQLLPRSQKTGCSACVTTTICVRAAHRIPSSPAGPVAAVRRGPEGSAIAQQKQATRHETFGVLGPDLVLGTATTRLLRDRRPGRCHPSRQRQLWTCRASGTGTAMRHTTTSRMPEVPWVSLPYQGRGGACRCRWGRADCRAASGTDRCVHTLRPGCPSNCPPGVRIRGCNLDPELLCIVGPPAASQQAPGPHPRSLLTPSLLTCGPLLPMSMLGAADLGYQAKQQRMMMMDGTVSPAAARRRCGCTWALHPRRLGRTRLPVA